MRSLVFALLLGVALGKPSHYADSNFMAESRNTEGDDKSYFYEDLDRDTIASDAADDNEDTAAADDNEDTYASRRQPATFNTLGLLQERRQAEILKNMNNGKIVHGMVSWKPAKSCGEIKDEWDAAPSGHYYIWYKRASSSRVQVWRVRRNLRLKNSAWCSREFI